MPHRQRELTYWRKQQDIVNAKVENQILYLDTYIRRESLIFGGIQEEPNEPNIRTAEKIREMFTNSLGTVNPGILKFQRCHRLGQKKAGSNQPREIIVKFLYYPDRELVLDRRKTFSGTNLYMNEDFPQEISRRRSKLYPAFKLAKEKHHKAKMQADKLIVDSIVYTVDSFHKLPSDIHPKQLAERKTDNAVFFYGKYSSFSSFHLAKFTLEGKQFNSVEQFFQYKRASSTGNQSLSDKIMDAAYPDEQFQLGKKIIPDPVKWNETTAQKFMELGVRAKFEQNDLLRSVLFSTNDKSIVKCNPYNQVWYCGLKINSPDVEDPTKWLGQNILGTILVKVPEDLKA